MRAGGAQKDAFPERRRALQAGNTKAGFCPSQSDSIEQDFRAPLIPNGEGQRQTKHAGLEGTKIPCLQSPYNTKYFPIWNQLVAAECEDRSLQVKIIYACPQEAGAKMATLSHFCASLLYWIPADSRAISMANPEV
jgi:hypothetical protein